MGRPAPALVRPGLSTAVLLTIAGVWAVVAGLVILFGAVRARRIPGFGWGWGVAAGLLTIALGLLLVLTPGITAALLGIFLGVYLVPTGIAYIRPRSHRALAGQEGHGLAHPLHRLIPAAGWVRHRPAPAAARTAGPG